MSKRILVGMMAIGMMAGVAYADNPGTVNLTVTVTPTLSVAVPRATYAFGTLGAAVASVAAESTAVINDSTDATEKYNLKASDALGTVPWNLVASGSEGTDTYSLGAKFNATKPGDFAAVAFDMENTDVLCDGTEFAGDQDGNNTAAGVEELLWFRIKTPTSVGSTDEHTIYITITALNQG